MSENPLKLVSDIYEFNKIQDFMDDPAVERALIKLTTILAKPDAPGVKVAKHIVECQALSAEFGIKARYYMGIGKNDPDASNKKNVYMTLKESFSELSNALKYIERAGG